MSYFEALILGLVQGLAEFLPVSSSGHLSILQSFFGIDADKVLVFSVLMHLGTLISVCIVYWKDLWELIVELGLTIKDLIKGNGLKLDERPVRKLGVLIILACIPTAIIGFVFNDLFESFYSNLYMIALGLIITGFLLWFADKRTGKKELERVNFRNALFIGTIQGIAVWPGISRSGSTLFASLVCGIKREVAAKFVFLISIPAILGSLILEVPDAVKEGVDPGVIGPIALGVIVAALSGLAAVKFMIKLISNNKFKYFSFYVWAVALVVIIANLIV